MEILTGNELISGATVYLDRSGNWSTDLQAARLFSTDEAAERDAALGASRASGRIISLDIEEISQEGSEIVPRRLRERIRAAGPTAPLSLNGRAYERQHLGDDGHVSI
ncbi:DUF2849 domain-containing protein [Devosia faecipullorum]|uniref:DUF2849 domain-containing protein n=1 Tax=Devosia faecipullorum TaxID=2755039 RepID=UPI00187B90A2|nr:DUF2849 domain-containing protein [Devosia faecipullorum]MBE7732121.1 DUF2849 domain-containing protein [Devosia faecipullorum]